MIVDSFQHPFVVVPETEDGLRRAIGKAHRRYTRYINFKKTGKAIFGKNVLRRSQWMNNIPSLLPDI